MKINKINFENFKNKQNSQDLTGLDIFIGSNGIGKSSILESIELALTGQLKGVSLPRNLFKNSNSDKKFSVEIETTDNYSLGRSFSKKKKNDKETGIESYTYDSKTLINKEKRGSKIAQKEIEKVLGVSNVSFDFNIFTSLSDTEKRKFILQFTKYSLTDKELKKYLLEKYDSDNSIEEEIDSLLKESQEQDNQKKIQELLDIAKERFSYYKKETSKLTAAIQKTMESENSLEIDSNGINIDKKLLEKKEEERIQLEKNIASQQVINENSEAANIKISNLQKNLIEIKNSTPSYSKEEIIALGKQKKEEQKELLIQNEDIINKLNGLTSKIQYEENIVNQIRKEYDSIKEQGIKYKAKLETINNLVLQVKSTNGCCAINKNIPCNANFSEWIKNQEQEINYLSKEVKKTFNLFTQKEQLLTKQINKVQALSQNREIGYKKQQDTQKAINAINQEINNLTAQYQQIISFDDIKNNKIETINNEINSLQNSIKDIVDLNPLIGKRQLLLNEIKNLKDLITNKEEANNIRKQIKDLEQKEQENIKLFNIYKYLVTALGPKGIQGEIFKKSITPIIDDINNNLNIMNIQKNFFINTNDEEVFSFGLDNVHFNSLSTGQQLILAIAIIITFIEKSNINLKILCIDNYENLDTENSIKVLEGLRNIYDSGKLDNIIIASCRDLTCDNYKIWKL